MKAQLELLESTDNYSSHRSGTIEPSVTEVSAEDKTATFVQSTDFDRQPESDPNKFSVGERSQKHRVELYGRRR